MGKVGWYRTLVIGGIVALLEVLCLAGVIDKNTMPAPHVIVRDLWRMMVSGRSRKPTSLARAMSCRNCSSGGSFLSQ